MTLAKTALQKLSNWKHPGDQRRTLVVAEEQSRWNLTVSADRCDELGCLVWELAFQRNAGPAAADAVGLRAWADRVAGRVTGLMETLRVVEVDAPRLEAQLRSQSPLVRDGQEFYYEVLLRAAGTASVRRYQAASPGQQRQQVLFPLTHEVLAKLAGDLTAEKQ
jgi:hypothetical protein